jgi:hypothetical protein
VSIKIDDLEGEAGNVKEAVVLLGCKGFIGVGINKSVLAGRFLSACF